MSKPTAKELEIIIEKLNNIEKGIERNDHHITFVTRLYVAIRDPILKLLRKIGGNSNDIVDVELGRSDALLELRN